MAERALPSAALPLLALLALERSAGRRLHALTGSAAERALAALSGWPTATWFEPFEALNMPAGDGAETGGEAALPLRARRRPAPLVPRKTDRSAIGAPPAVTEQKGQAASRPDPAWMKRQASADTAATPVASTLSTLDAQRQAVAVMQALLAHPVPGHPPSTMAAARMAPAPTADLAPVMLPASALMQSLLAPSPYPGRGPSVTSDLAPLARPPIGLGSAMTAPATRSRSAPIPFADALANAIESLPQAAPAQGRVKRLDPRAPAPRAASRLLDAEAPTPADAEDIPASPSSFNDNADDDLLGAVTRSLIDQAWLRGVNLS